jgi:CDP-4-dehydro-6-deoxyglucose reductase
MTFKIRIQSSGREFTAGEKETVLAAALRQGVMLPYSCRNGACGSCKGKLLSGQIDYGTYETKAMSEAEREQGRALFCQARPLSDLVKQRKSRRPKISPSASCRRAWSRWKNSRTT